MSFDWLAFFTLAGEIIANPLVSPEASERTAISRAYYAAFNLAANRLETKTPPEWKRSGKASDHGELATFLQRFGKTKKATVGVNLSRLYEYRCHADYDDDFPGSSSKFATAAMNLAKSAIEYIPQM